jgi:hypothetical protein
MVVLLLIIREKMIDVVATLTEYGYLVMDLPPQSNKPIIAICDDFCLGTKFSEDHKANLSAAKKGEKHPNWQDGISFEPYCIKFNDEYKEYIRNLFGNKCFLCSLSEADNGRKLSVHHVNYNKKCGCDETKCICVPLCISCHSKTGTDRDFWQALIMEMLKPIEAWM